MALFKINMYFPDGYMQDLNKLRTAHLSYLKSQYNLHYGGISLNEKEEYSCILYIVDSPNKEDAIKFVEKDPYYALASCVDVESFIQKIPKLA